MTVQLYPKRVFLLCALIIGVQFLPACKKGKDDPFFSFRPRKERLTGEWRVITGEKSIQDTTWILSDDHLLIRFDSLISDSLPFRISYLFDKEGSYSEITEIDYPTNWMGGGNPAFKEITTITGFWNFTGGAGNSKSKSQLLLQETRKEVTASNRGSDQNIITYEGQPEGFVYNIRELRNNKMVLTYHLSSEFPGGSISKNEVIVLEK